MSLINFIRLISPDGETWENYSRRKWGVGVTRWHGFLNGKMDKAWFKILSRPDATLRWRSLLNKGWRETTRRNPDNWTQIGEYWIEDSGRAMDADGDIGDMNHEAYVIDGLASRLLNAMNIDVDDRAGSLDGWRKDITAAMKEDEFEGDEDEFIEKAAKEIWKDEKQRNAAIACAWGSGDARKYGMQYDNWIRVAGHGFECWEMNDEVLKRMGDGIYDAGYEDVADDEIFEIYVHKTQMHYTDVPWVVISEGDPGKLRIYGTKNNPRVNLKKAAKVPARLLARGTRVEMEHTRSKRAARIIASHHIAEDPRYYAKLAVMERNPPRVLSYAEAHRWEPLAKARGVSAVARSERGFMRMYQRAGTWDNVNDYWRKRRAAFIARHMAQGRHEALWKKDRSGKLQPSRRCLALIMWAYKP